MGEEPAFVARAEAMQLRRAIDRVSEKQIEKP
jgi:hypothetical protein